MMKWMIAMIIGVWLGFGNAWSSGAIPVTIVNYSARPVYAAAVSLDAEELWRKLGVAANTPLRVGGKPAPAYVLGQHNGRPVLRIYVALAAGQRLDLTVEQGDQWPTGGTATASCVAPERADGEIRNGIVRAGFENGRWNFGFDTTPPTNALLLENGRVDFWIDPVRHGRLQNENPATLGLEPYKNSSLVKSEAFVREDGTPVFRTERRMAGIAGKMTVVESYELAPGLPLLTYRLRWKNDGDKPLWVAYVESGDGVKGRWSPVLMQGPLVERQKSPVKGDINGAETRPNWLGAMCRVSMESAATGCGVGLSTLLKNGPVGVGSMVWSIDKGSFQCNFIDPKQGQFPFLVEPHGVLDNGFAFLAASTDISVFRRTSDLWRAFRDGRLPDLKPPCAVFVDGTPVHAQTVSGVGNPDGTWREMALRMDFNKTYEFRVDVQKVDPAAPVEVLVRRFPAGKKDARLLQIDKPGQYKVDLNKTFTEKDEVDFLLTVKAGDRAAIRNLAVAETLPEAPAMLAPVADSEITDLAAMFRWRGVPLVVDYRLQMARTPDFASAMDVAITSSATVPQYMVPDDKLPAPGTWYWRVRAEKGGLLGTWSDARRFVVNNDHTRKPLKRPLSARKPLFTMEATWVSDFRKFNPDIPADLMPYIGIVAEGMEGKLVSIQDGAQGLDKLPCGILLRSHDLALSDIEWMFQHVPNMIGMQGGERLGELYNDSGAMRYRHRAIRLCAKYGMFHQEADGTYKYDKWQDMMDKHGAFIRDYGPWLVLSQKNNIIRRQFYSQSCAMGLWLGGITHQHGAWEDGGFYWQNAGFNGMGVCQGERSGKLNTMPRIFWALNMVMGISRGCGIYSMDGQTLTGNAVRHARDPKTLWHGELWDNTGKTTDTFKRYVVPLIRGVVAHSLIPSKDDVLANIKLAVYNDKKTKGDVNKWPHYVEYGPLYAATYGFRRMGNHDGQLWEFFPNTGRFYFIPVLPQGNVLLANGIRNVPVSELQDTESVKSVFEAAYPKWYEGDALVCRIGDTLTIQNSRENEDVSESYAIPLAGTRFKVLKGTVAAQSYLVARSEKQGQQLWLQSNTEFPDRDTVLSVVCERNPRCTVTPPDSAVESRWDESTQTLNLRLSQRQGAVEVLLEQFSQEKQ